MSSPVMLPNVDWSEQTIEQLQAERAYWIGKVETARGFGSADLADRHRKAIENWIQLKQPSKN